jgi:hypothetical protein
VRTNRLSYADSETTNPGVKILKYVEGQFHKGLILKMDNGIESFISTLLMFH